jgi:hypothetical protein
MSSRTPEAQDIPQTDSPTDPGRREFFGVAAAAVVAAPALLAGGSEAAAAEPQRVRALSSKEPWWTLHKKLLASIGAADHVSVKPLEGSGSSWKQYIVTDDSRTGTGLATVLNKKHVFDNVTVTIYVTDSRGRSYAGRTISKQSDLVYAMKDALIGNKCSCGVLKESLDPGTPVVAIFAPCVVKFFDEVASDYYGNFQRVAACAFCDLFNSIVGGFKITATTRDLTRC